MSKYVKNLISDNLRDRLAGVEDALLVNVIGLGANATNRLRGALEAKEIHVLVVKNSLAQRALAGSRLAPMFDGLSGTSALCWGGEDVISLAKEIVRLVESKEFEPLAARGGVMDGDALTAAQVAAVSKWPNRMEQLSILVGQMLSPGAMLASQLTGPAEALASQVEQKAKGADGPEDAAPAPVPA
jgi:large subunit ribosomal protein L10